jgi:hypothetical protein
MDDKAFSQRFETLLSLETHHYLKELARRGTHGTSAPAVGRTLIEQGVRAAIRQGFIKIKDDELTPV